MDKKGSLFFNIIIGITIIALLGIGGYAAYYYLSNYFAVKEAEEAVDEFERKVTIGNTVYTVATGGLHSEDKPRILKSTSKYKYKHWDISSFYPSLIVTYKIVPKHLDEEAVVLYTSGSESLPKAVPLTHKNLIAEWMGTA